MHSATAVVRASGVIREAKGVISSAALRSYEARASDGSSAHHCRHHQPVQFRQTGDELRTILASRVFRTRTLDDRARG